MSLLQGGEVREWDDTKEEGKLPGRKDGIRKEAIGACIEEFFF